MQQLLDFVYISLNLNSKKPVILNVLTLLQKQKIKLAHTIIEHGQY